MDKQKMAVGVSIRCGLAVDICLTMLTAGWIYIEEIEKPARWERQF